MSQVAQISHLLNHLSFALVRQSDQVLQERLGIGFSQYKILTVVQYHPHLQQRKIADSLGQTEASISRQIKLMHDQGLLMTQVNPENRREHTTTLTPRGVRLASEATATLEGYHAPVINALSDKQQKQFLELLELMHNQSCKPDRLTTCQHACKPETTTN